MKMILNIPLAIALLATTILSPLLADGSVADSVGIKCQVTHWTRDSSGDQRFLRSMKLKVKSDHSGVQYFFDQVETLSAPGKADLKIWIEGHYFHNNDKDSSFMRFSSTACGNKPGTADVNCFGRDHSGDIFANVVKAKTIHHGKNLLIYKTAVPASDFSKSYEAQMKYRLITGRSLLKDLDTNDPVQREKYLALLTPIVGVECSVRDDAYGVVSGL